MSLRLRDLQQILGKFTNGNKGTAILIVLFTWKQIMDNLLKWVE